MVQGGTATAVYLARRLGIPTFNLRSPDMFQCWSFLAGIYLSLSHPMEGHPFGFPSRIMREIPEPDS